MIESGGITYYIDFDELDKVIATDKSLEAQDVTEVKKKKHLDDNDKVITTEVTTRTYPKSKEIDGARYDCIGLMLQVIMNGETEIDDTLGMDRGLAAMPLNWKIAFNTLKNCGILKAIEE